MKNVNQIHWMRKQYLDSVLRTVPYINPFKNPIKFLKRNKALKNKIKSCSIAIDTIIANLIACDFYSNNNSLDGCEILTLKEASSEVSEFVFSELSKKSNVTKLWEVTYQLNHLAERVSGSVATLSRGDLALHKQCQSEIDTTLAILFLD